VRKREVPMQFLRRWWLAILAVALGGFVPSPGGSADYLPGDPNADGVVDLGDAAFILHWMSSDGPAPTCWAAADTSGDVAIDLTDYFYLIKYLYHGGPPPQRSSAACASYDPAPPPELADFSLGFEAASCPAVVAGTTVLLDVYATLTTKKDQTTDGAEGWALSLTAEGATIQAITSAGLHVSTVFQKDPPPAPPLDPYDLDLKDAPFQASELAEYKDDPRRKGAVSEFLLYGFRKDMGLEPSGAQKIAKITLAVAMPASGDPATVKLWYEDGFRGSGQAVKNLVVLDGTTQTPALGSLTLVLGLRGSDCNCNGVPDAQDIASGGSQDCNGNGIPDECEAECNGNHIPDSCDIASGRSQDCNQNGIPDECEPGEQDCNGNHSPDSCDIASGRSKDCNQNGIPDECEPECNGNHIPDSCDIASGRSQDCNHNGIPDECEPDCNGNGKPDDCDIASGRSKDCDGNHVPDECDADCNLNGITDGCDIANGTLPDSDGNGVPDTCSGAQSKPNFILGFEGCPERLQGVPGEVKVFEAYVTLTTSYSPLPYGSFGWQIGIAADGGKITSISYSGIHLSAVVKQFPGSWITPYDVPLDLVILKPFSTLTTTPDGRSAAVSVADLEDAHGQDRVTLQPRGTQKIGKIRVQVQIPPVNDPPPLTLRFDDTAFLPGPTGPHSNLVWGFGLGPTSFFPELRSCDITFSQRPSFIRGDANVDAAVDVSDAVRIFSYLFLGTPPTLQCEDAADANESGEIDISDGIYLLGFLFTGGPPPPTPFPICGGSAKPSDLTCQNDQACGG
jgi:hypothetical protein